MSDHSVDGLTERCSDIRMKRLDAWGSEMPGEHLHSLVKQNYSLAREEFCTRTQKPLLASLAQGSVWSRRKSQSEVLDS
jgi:hypothetical protein